MDTAKQILKDVIMFAVIALVGALFGFSTAGGSAVIIGRVVCYVSSVLAALSFFVKRPPESAL